MGKTKMYNWMTESKERRRRRKLTPWLMQTWSLVLFTLPDTLHTHIIHFYLIIYINQLSGDKDPKCEHNR